MIIDTLGFGTNLIIMFIFSPSTWNDDPHFPFSPSETISGHNYSDLTAVRPKLTMFGEAQSVRAEYRGCTPGGVYVPCIYSHAR